MNKSNDKTALHWLLPSMARDGLVKNGDWVLAAAAEAEGMFPDPQLRLPAQFLAVLNRFALDYIKQAPALVVAASHGANLLNRKSRVEVGRRFIAACENGPKLAALMQSYGLAVQLRALSGQAVGHDHRDLLVALSKMLPASMLAQAIPKIAGEQRVWLQSLENWRVHMGRHFRNRNLFLDWAATNVRDARHRSSATDIADFAVRSRGTFNLDWTFAQAHAASQRWHLELALRPPVSEASRPDWRTLIDYAPLPSHVEVEGHDFHALQTREAIFEEGARMHHCVRLYADKVAQGNSRIYSVRQAGQPIATLELVRLTRASAGVHKFLLAQIKGPRNSKPADCVSKAASAFLESINLAARPGDHAVRRGDRACEALRQQLGDPVYDSWFSQMQFGEFDGNELQISFPTRFLARWVEAHFMAALFASCACEFAGVAKLTISHRAVLVVPRSFASIRVMGAR